VSIALAQEALKDKLSDGSDNGEGLVPLSVQRIQAIVAQLWHVTPEALQSKTRTKTLTVPRQAAMLLCRELLGLQLAEIGHSFGGRDHSTVIHSLERATELAATDSSFATRFEQARHLLGQSGNPETGARVSNISTTSPLRSS
jgi:chromosomal replication initiator protein